MDFVGSAGSDYRKAEAEGKAGLKIHSTLPLRIIGNDKPRSTNFGHDLVRNSTDKLFGINAQRSVTGRSYRWLKAVRPRSDECRVNDIATKPCDDASVDFSAIVRPRAILSL